MGLLQEMFLLASSHAKSLHNYNWCSALPTFDLFISKSHKKVCSLKLTIQVLVVLKLTIERFKPYGDASKQDIAKASSH